MPAAPQNRLPPAAPPAYSPHPVPKVLQTKQGQQGFPRPTAKVTGLASKPPHLPRPASPASKVLQTRKAVTEQPHAVQTLHTPPAPRPLQPQLNYLSARPSTPGVKKPPLASPPAHPPHTVQPPGASNSTPAAPTTIQRTTWGGLGMLVGAYVGAVPGALVGGLVGSVLDYMNRPQAVNPPHDPQPDPVAEHRRGLAASARHFSETGRPRYPQLANVYPNGVDTQRWVALTGLEDISKVKKKARSGNQQAKHSLVKHLFHKFTTYGFNYEIMSGYALCLLDSNYAKDSAEGNCLAYAKAFADILNSFGIDATQKSVRKESEGRFIVKVDDFIDPKVRGHIYEKGQLKQGYYMFTSHAATWVPSENKFYDPMAKISYTSLAPYIECEIASDKNEVVFWPTTRPKTLVPHYKWKLIRRQKTGPGGFHRTDLVPLNKK